MNSGSEKQAKKLIYEGEEMQMTPKILLGLLNQRI